MADPTIEDDLRHLFACVTQLSPRAYADVKAARDRVAAALKERSWQPIPDPPPNGVAVIAAPSGGIAVGCWDAAFGTWGVYLGEEAPTLYLRLPPTPFDVERASKRGNG